MCREGHFPPSTSASVLLPSSFLIPLKGGGLTPPVIQSLANGWITSSRFFRFLTADLTWPGLCWVGDWLL